MTQVRHENYTVTTLITKCGKKNPTYCYNTMKTQIEFTLEIKLVFSSWYWHTICESAKCSGVSTILLHWRMCRLYRLRQTSKIFMRNDDWQREWRIKYWVEQSVGRQSYASRIRDESHLFFILPSRAQLLLLPVLFAFINNQWEQSELLVGVWWWRECESPPTGWYQSVGYWCYCRDPVWWWRYWPMATAANTRRYFRRSLPATGRLQHQSPRDATTKDFGGGGGGSKESISLWQYYFLFLYIYIRWHIKVAST